MTADTTCSQPAAVQGTQGDERRGHPRLPVAATAALPGLLVALYLGVGWARRWTVDDAFINYRVVKQIQAGNGPVFNAGERVEVATSTLWLAVLTVADLVSPFRLEWSALGCQLVLGAMGLVAGMAGALRLARLRSPDHRATGVILPLGAAASCGVTVAWDFATGGLENGLTMAWLGGTFWAVVALVDHGAAASRRRLLVTAALVGLGVLVRPDFAPFCAGFAVPIVAVARRRGGWRSVVTTAAAAGALPVAWQVFRMGYYGQLVPNTLHAKESSRAWWGQGWTYLLNFAVPYGIVVPVAATATWLASSWRQTGDATRCRDWRLVVGGLEAAAALHVLGVARVGGDYMHGRLLLPAWFALLLPIFAIRSGELRAPRHAAAGAVIAAWLAVSVVWLRPPEGSLFNRWVEERYDAGTLTAIGADDPVGIVDVREHTVPAALVANPVRWDHFFVWEPGLRYDATTGWYDPNTYRPDRGAGLPTPPGVEASVVPGFVLGAASYALPLDVWVHDALGLADPVVARAELSHRGTAGHEKLLSPPWVAAGWVDPATAVPDPATFSALPEFAWVWTGTAVPLDTDVETFEAEREAAREALSCGPLRELVHNTRAPLTPTRFLGNIVDSVRLHDLRVPVDPHEARDQLCG